MSSRTCSRCQDEYPISYFTGSETVCRKCAAAVPEVKLAQAILPPPVVPVADLLGEMKQLRDALIAVQAQSLRAEQTLSKLMTDMDSDRIALSRAFADLQSCIEDQARVSAGAVKPKLDFIAFMTVYQEYQKYSS